MRTLRWVVVLSLWGPGGVQGQDQPSCGRPFPSWCGLSAEENESLLIVRQATRSYQSSAAAVADGFRPVGADAPAMGRHWVSLARLFDGEIDPARPEILMYAVVDGRETLVGIGFGYVVNSGEDKAPPPNPFDPDAWHLHSGRLDMESHRTDHEGSGLHGAQSEPSRLSTFRNGHGQEGAGISVLHAWVQVENPAGAIEPNNWALPYFRLGLSRPADATPQVDRAISLASLGTRFFIDRAKLFTDEDSGPASGWAAALRGAEAEVGEWWRTRPVGPLTSEEVVWLGELWGRFGLAGL